MPLEMRGVKGINEWYGCCIPACVNRTNRRVYFMGHEMGNICSRHAKEWEQAWADALANNDDEC